MLTLLLMIIFGTLFSLIATQNTLNVPVQLFSFRFSNIPIYLIALVALLTGVFLSWSISLFDWFTNIITLRGKEQNLRHLEVEINKLQNQIDELQAENSKLKNEKTTFRNESNMKTDNLKSSYSEMGILDRLRQSISI